MRIFKNIFKYILTFLIVYYLLMGIDLPYYIYKPGTVEQLDEMIEVEGRTESEGTLHLVTIQSIKATPLIYVIGKVMPYYDIIPEETLLQEGESDEDRNNYNLMLMDQSKEAAKYVALTAANKPVTLKDDGVTVVGLVEDMPAASILERRDILLRVDEVKITKTEDLIDYLQTKQAGDEVKLVFKRHGKQMEAEVILQALPDSNQLGIGIQSVTSKQVETDLDIKLDSKRIGGPSAGFIFTLEMYDQLVAEDITKGYEIVGTGEMNFDGQIGQIGGVDKKVVAAHKSGADIFLVPADVDDIDSNTAIAKETAKALKTEMEIVPVATFEEALDYLAQLEPKS